MNPDKKTEIAVIEAPYNKQIKLEEMDYDGGMHLYRITIKERSRFTTLDLDPDTARELAQNLIEWANKHTGD